MQIIKNWLAGPKNFIVGALLYKSLGHNDELKSLLAKGETPYARKLLEDELRKMIAPGEVIKRPQVTYKIDTSEMPASDDAVLQSLRNEWLVPYQRMNLLRHHLDKFGVENTSEAITYRHGLAKEILQIEQECMKVWAKRHHYLKEGKLPFVAEKKTDIPSDPIKLAALINNIKKNIRRNRQFMKENPGEPKYVQLYNLYKQQYKQVTGEDYKEKP